MNTSKLFHPPIKNIIKCIADRTQFFLLPTLLIFVYYKHSLFFLKYKNPITLNLFYFFIFYMVWWVVEYYTLNQYTYSVKNIQYFFNNLLSNPLNKYHPILFFISYIFMYNILVYNHLLVNFRTFVNSKFIYVTKYSYILTKNAYIWILMSVSLYLGSWWALQEGSWGGWWNWDSSEVFGLLILTSLLIIFHLSKNYNSQIFFTCLIFFFIVIITFLYFILQLSYNLVSHNFGLSLIGYGYVQFIFKTNLSIILISCFIVWFGIKCLVLKTILCKNIYYIVYSQNNNKLNIQFIKLKIVLLISLLFYIYTTTFNPIFNNIFWNSLNINLLNNLLHWVNIKLITLIILWLFLLRFNFFTLIIYVYYTLTYVITYLFNLPIYTGTVSLFKTLHTLILMILSLSLYLQFYLFSQWELLRLSSTDWYNSYNRLVFRGNVFTDNTYIYIILGLLDSLNQNLSPSSYSFFHNINTQLFSLNLNDSLLKQTLYSSNYLYIFKVSIHDNPSSVTDLSTLPIILIVYYLYSRKLKIIF
jgi:hypothetical protein